MKSNGRDTRHQPLLFTSKVSVPTHSQPASTPCTQTHMIKITEESHRVSMAPLVLFRILSELVWGGEGAWYSLRELKQKDHHHHHISASSYWAHSHTRLLFLFSLSCDILESSRQHGDLVSTILLKGSLIYKRRKTIESWSHQSFQNPCESAEGGKQLFPCAQGETRGARSSWSRGRERC